MVLVLLWWCMVLLATVPVGHALVRMLAGQWTTGIDEVPLVHVFTLGLFASSTWAMAWSLFAGLGAIPLLAWMLASGILAIAQQRALRGYLGRRIRELRGAHALAQVGLLLVFVVALLKSCDPSELYDEGGYILPYIRWLEHYGAVPGIANIEERFGFNSALHATSALFSLHWLDGQGTYDLNGLVLVMVATWFMGGASDLMRGGPVRLSAILKVFSLLFYFRNMLTGPRPDLPAMLIAEMVLVLAAEKIENGTTLLPDLSFKILVLYGVFLAGIKFTAVIVALYPLYLLVTMWVRGIHVRPGRPGALTLLFLLPWVGMNAVVSGYLVYPLYQVDVLRVDWKVPAPLVRQQYFYVSEFAKTNARPVESEQLHRTRSMRQWVPVWFARENGINKTAAVALLAAALGLLVLLLLRGRRLWREDREILVLGSVLLLADLVWFLRTPAFRFGWATIIGMIAFSAFLWLRGVRHGQVLRVLTLALLASSTLLSVTKTVHGSWPSIGEQLIRPASLPHVASLERDLNGLPVREATGYPCWGTAPPCFHHGTTRTVEPRGPAVSDGFRAAPR